MCDGEYCPINHNNSNPSQSCKVIHYHGTKHGWTGLMDSVVNHAEATALDLYQLEENIQKKLDDRLFPNEPLYCEGMHKPALRGFLHLYSAILLLFAYWHLLREANSSLQGEIAAILYITGNLFCCTSSALYHIGRWSPPSEILLQKMDHCGIAICTASMNFPAACLLLPWPGNFLLGGLSTITCLWTTWNIAMKRPGVWRLIINACVILLFFPSLFGYYMTWLEIICVLINTLCQVIGVIIFVNKIPDPWPAVFGYHEVFHVFTVVGFLSVYICNWSIIHRTCSPYAYRIDVWEILLDTFWRSEASL
eukprot:gene5408-5948_t